MTSTPNTSDMESTKRPVYGTSHENLTMAVYRWLRHQWDASVEQNGDDLLHEAFTLDKIINGYELDDHEKYALITALFQNRKTFVAIAVLAVYITAGYTAIVVATGSNQAVQIVDRIIEGFSDLYRTMLEKGFAARELYMFREVLYQDSKMTQSQRNEMKRKQEEAVTNRTPRSNRCIVTFKEWTQVQPFANIISSSGSQSRVITIIDEAHKNGGMKNLVEEQEEQGDDKCHYDKAIFELKMFSQKVLYITATPAKILMSEENLWTDNIFFKKRHPGYRGPEMVEYHTDMPKHKNKEAVWNKIVEILAEVSGTPPVIRKHEMLGEPDQIPHMVLVHFVRQLKAMSKAFRSFRLDNGATGAMPREVKDGDWMSMTYFGEGIRIWHPSLATEEIIVDERRSCDMGEGEHFFPSSEEGGISFNGLLQWLGRNGGVKRFPRIVIFSYDMAWESISFSTHRAPYWHLNRIIVSGNHSADDTSQLIGRNHGIHYDNVVQHVHSSSYSKQKAVKEVSFVMEEVVRKVRAIANMRVVDVMRTEEWYSNRVPQKFLTMKNSVGGLGLKTKKNPNSVLEDQIFRKNKAIDIFTKMHPELYKDIQARMKLIQVEAVEGELVGKQKGCFLGVVLVVPGELRSGLPALYKRAQSYILGNYGTNVWVARKNLVNAFATNEGRKNPLRGRFSEMVEKSISVEDENTIGLLAKKVEREIYFRVN